MIKISDRLLLIASMVKEGARVCDIGTDHAYLPIYLSSTKKAQSVIATDIRKKPLENARGNIEKSRADNIELRLCDGLSGVKAQEVDTIIIAGMGGEVIAAILEACAWKKNKELSFILQAMTSAEELRRYLYKNGFEIFSEPTVQDNDRVYSVMQVRYTGNATEMPEEFYCIGKIDISTENGKRYITKQFKRYRECALSLADIPEKVEEYIYYSQLSKKLEEKLNGI